MSEEKQTIARLEQEIARLRGRLADERFAEDLRDALTLAATTGALASPVTHSRLLEMIVETAAHVISARAASLFLLNEATQELVFEVALGQKAEQVKKFTVPLGRGIAGYVAQTGQPMAIANAQSDPRRAGDEAISQIQSVGGAPETILCVPLFYNDQIIGVLELLDKVGAATFSAGDMESLGLFANQAAVAIAQSQTHQNLAALLGETLESLAAVPDAQRGSLRPSAREFASRLEGDESYRRTLDLAGLVHEIAARGDNEFAACQTILRGFAEYLRTQAAALPGGGNAR